MRKSLQGILFLKAFMLGTIAPIFILLLTSHGATVQTVSLFVVAASLFTLLAEFPSGVFADLFGRKLSFILSLLLQLGSFVLILLFRSAFTLACAMVLYGLSRAFVSGSVEALAIDEEADQTKLVKITSRLNILESGGLAAGALLSGVLASIAADYLGNILFNIFGFTVVLLLTLFTVKESAHIKTRQTAPPRLNDHLKTSFTFVRASHTAQMLFILSALTAFAMVTLETYWQPAVKSFTSSTLIFGVIGGVGFAGVVFGSKLSEWLFARLPKHGAAVFLLSKLLMSLCLALLITAQTQTPFILIYVLWYLFLGSNGVAEQTPAQSGSALRAARQYPVDAFVHLPHRLACRKSVVLPDQLRHGLPLQLADRRRTTGRRYARFCSRAAAAARYAPRCLTSAANTPKNK